MLSTKNSSELAKEFVHRVSNHSDRFDEALRLSTGDFANQYAQAALGFSKDSGDFIVTDAARGMQRLEAFQMLREVEQPTGSKADVSLREIENSPLRPIEYKIKFAAVLFEIEKQYKEQKLSSPKQKILKGADILGFTSLKNDLLTKTKERLVSEGFAPRNYSPETLNKFISEDDIKSLCESRHINLDVNKIIEKTKDAKIEEQNLDIPSILYQSPLIIGQIVYITNVPHNL